MVIHSKQGALFEDAKKDLGTTVHINGRSQLRRQDGFTVVTFMGMPIYHYINGDRMAEAHAMVSLVEQGYARQTEVARAFGCTTRTVRRYQERHDKEGLSALGRSGGYPKGKPRLQKSRDRLVGELRSKGYSNREVATRIGVSEKAVRKQLRRLGWKQVEPEQMSLAFGSQADADPNLSALPTPTPDEVHVDDAGPVSSSLTTADPNLSAIPTATPNDTHVDETGPVSSSLATADPNLSAFSAPDDDEGIWPSLDADPSHRCFDRLMAHLGLLMDARPLFRDGTRIPGAGVLLAIPAIVESGVIAAAREIYGDIGPAFYGLRTTILFLVLMGLLRIKRPENLKERSPDDLGRILGLDRAPEVKTVRRKLSRLALWGRAVAFGRALARRRVQKVGAAVGFLYVDGHVRVYHGQERIPKAHVARMHFPMPATTDYWVNDAAGDPLFIVTADANAGLVKMLPKLMDEVRSLVGERRITVVFDRGGWSPKLFASLIAAGFDILTYRKGKSRKVPLRRFEKHQAIIDGREVEYTLADQQTLLLKRKLRLRQVTRLSENGHQTQIITSRRDLSAIEVAFRMFERWRQENFFKYLREEYAIDALVDYQVEPDDEERDVPNPVWNALDAKLRKARAEVAAVLSQYGLEALTNVEEVRRTMRGFKIANAKIAREIEKAQRQYIALKKKRDAVPRRVPVKQVVNQEVVKLATERKHITTLLKMVAYQAESDLCRMLAPHYARTDDEGRTLIQTALAAAADIEVTDNELHIRLAPLSSPHRSRAIVAVCEALNQKVTLFPGTKLRLRYSVHLPENL
jgi:transposase